MARALQFPRVENVTGGIVRPGSSSSITPERAPFITVVTGVPRSGTSLMMQMLLAGGLGVETDGIRPPDENNVRGYFELETMKRLSTRDLRADLQEMIGTAVKIVCPLVRYLPRDLPYRIIMMRRDVREILASQRAMLLRLGVANVQHDNEDGLAVAIAQEWSKLRAWAMENSRTQLLEVDYHSLVWCSREASEAVNFFLNDVLDTSGMLTAVDTRLHRVRADRSKLS